MFGPEDHIALALSGGKDSVSLLHILKKIEKKFPRATLSAITIDEGIEKYRKEAIEIAQENCEKLNVPLHIYSFKEMYGKDLDQIAHLSSKRGKLSICSYCGVLRRKALNLAAKDLGVSKLTLAHNLDDEIQSMTLSVLRGDLRALSRVKPVQELVEGFVQRVKPFREILEREVALYAHLESIRFQGFSCPYLESSMRSDVRRFLNELERKHAGVKYSLYRSFEKIQVSTQGLFDNERMAHCQTCGEPSSGKICRACQSLKDLRASTID
jgi:uncharacterized protein (TIGR00269 family)